MTERISEPTISGERIKVDLDLSNIQEIQIDMQQKQI